MIAVSACLAGECCRFDGKACVHKEIKRLVEEKKAIAVCPECLGGLPVPRCCCEIIGGKVMSSDGKDRTANFISGAEKALAIALKNGCTLAVMKSKSPSCGTSQIYDGTFSGRLKKGSGIAAQMFMDHGIRVIDEHTFASFQISE